MKQTQQDKCNDFLREIMDGHDWVFPARDALMLLLRVGGFGLHNIKLAKLYWGVESYQQGRHWYWRAWKRTPRSRSTEDA